MVRKTVVVVSIFALLGGLLSGCSNPESKPVIIEIDRPANYPLYMVTMDSLGFNSSEQIKFEENATALISRNINNQEIRFQTPAIKLPLRVYLRAGDSLRISFALDSTENTLRFELSGPQSGFQKYLLRKDQVYEKIETELWQVTAIDLPDSLVKFDLVWKQERKAENLDPSLAAYDSLTDWTRILNLELTKFFSSPSKDTSRVRTLFLELTKYDPRLKGIRDFSDLVYNIQSLLITLNQWEHEDLIESDLLALTAENTSPLSVHPFIVKWIQALLISQIGEYGIDGDLGKQFRNYISSDDSPTVFVNALDQKAHSWKNVSRGSPAPDVKLIELEGDTVKLSQYFGKYVYIDLWASWCRPCITEFPHGMVTMLDSRFKDFTFLYINMDASMESWKRSLETYEVPKGIQLYIPGEWDNELFHKYNQTALPRYLIIDPSGKIINAHAPRPSQREKILVDVANSSQL